MKQEINNGHLTWVGIDFDDVICRNSGLPDFTPLELIDGVKEAIIDIRSKGLKPVIFTARGWDEHEIVKKFCKKHELDIEFIICGKPLLRYMIDDRSLEFKGDWKEIISKIK